MKISLHSPHELIIPVKNDAGGTTKSMLNIRTCSTKALPKLNKIILETFKGKELSEDAKESTGNRLLDHYVKTLYRLNDVGFDDFDGSEEESFQFLRQTIRNVMEIWFESNRNKFDLGKLKAAKKPQVDRIKSTFTWKQADHPAQYVIIKEGNKISLKKQEEDASSNGVSDSVSLIPEKTSSQDIILETVKNLSKKLSACSDDNDCKTNAIDEENSSTDLKELINQLKSLYSE